MFRLITRVTLTLALLTAATIRAQAPPPAPTGDVIGIGNFTHIVADRAPGASFRQSRATIPGITTVPFTLIEFKNAKRKERSGRTQDPGVPIVTTGGTGLP